MVRKHSPRRWLEGSFRQFRHRQREFLLSVFLGLLKRRGLKDSPKAQENRLVCHVPRFGVMCQACSGFHCRKSLLFVFLALKGSRPPQVFIQNVDFVFFLYGTCLTKRRRLVSAENKFECFSRKKGHLVMSFHCRLTPKSGNNPFIILASSRTESVFFLRLLEWALCSNRCDAVSPRNFLLVD